MLGLLRLMSGRRLLIVAVLAVLLLSGSAALRSGGARLLACGVSLQMSDPTGATGRGHRRPDFGRPRTAAPAQPMPSRGHARCHCRDGLASLASRCKPGSSSRVPLPEP